jgi:hypothetical protein
MTSETIQLDKVVKDAWKLAEADSENLPGLSMQSLLETADTNNQSRNFSALNNWLVIFDECGAWFGNLASLLLFTLKTNASRRDEPLRRVLTQLIGNVTAQIIAIRRLVVAGLDVQAKQLLRTLVEQLDVALLVSMNPDALSDFENTLDGASANEFWHKHLAKGRLRSKAHTKLKERLGETSYQEFVAYFKQEEQILGMAIHPSLGASQMVLMASIIGEDYNRPFTLGFVGDISPFSERTLAYAVFYMLFYILDGYVPELEQGSEVDHGAQSALGDLRDRVCKGKIALLAIIIFAIINKDRPEFLTPISYHVFAD